MTELQVQHNTQTRLPQLKKLEFLNAFPEGPANKGQVIEALEGFAYIPSYVDYLLEHFVATGKLVQNEDGTWQRKGKKTGGAGRNEYRVEQDDEGNYHIATRVIEGKVDTEGGWAMTQSKAVKNAASAVFQNYMDQTKAIKALLQADEAQAESSDE